MTANTKYRIRGVIFADTTAAGDFKFGFVGPAYPTLVRVERIQAIAGAAPAEVIVDTALPTAIALAGTGTTGVFIRIDAVFHNASAAGTFAFQFAQNSATNDTGAIVRAGSYIEYAIA